MAEALATAFTNNLLMCSICLGEYEDPRVLPCYHTFCYGCISDHASRTLTPNRIFVCPICREETKFPAGGLNQLKKNFIFSKAKDIITQQRERQTLEEKQTNVAAVTQAIAHMTISCEKHPNNELKYYCEDEDIVVCGDCASTDHYRHGIVPVDKVAKSNRDKIKAALVKTIKTSTRFKEAVAMETIDDTGDNHSRIATIKNIKEQVHGMRTYIDQREETLISEVNSAYDIRKKQKEANKDTLEFHHSSLHSACDFAQELVTNGTDSDIMVHVRSLIERLAAMEKTPVPILDTPAQISYKPGEISSAGLEAMLGQVTVQTQPPLAGTYPSSPSHPPVFLGKPQCVHSFSANLREDSRQTSISGIVIDTDLMYIVDNSNDRIKMFTHAGEITFCIKHNRPLNVAVSQTGDLYITSNYDNCVKVYSTRGQQVTTMGQGQLKEPYGITLNRQGDVMVCDTKEKSIFTFHADSGQLVNTFPLFLCSGPQNITVNSVNDNIIISDISMGIGCVHVLSPTGDYMYQYGGKNGEGNDQKCLPDGVCTDSYGHIFIADWGSGYFKILVLSPKAEFVRYIVTTDDKEDWLQYGIGLAINPAGQLVVGEKNGKVKTFQYLE
ncbi:tripartite motif-containing protein 2-like [Lingula anatina]|uniref:Tripartite motif-containing protein 2-like n=1 Tax=Lingula anatina TaxID=7574 RepID=A0A1S3I4C0_LINAN|nr:tripartite motif-containing protein 2-like [Lingula anatina]|eukprot:XP_013393073.1 tripartite motif-containing protein 2-like [Lingula anatina]